MKKLTPLLMLVLAAFVPTRLSAFDNTYYRSLAAMPLAVDACARSGQVSDDQLGRFVLRLNDANVPPTLFVETVRYAPYALQQPDFFPFVDSEISQGVTGAALVTVINERLPRYGVTVRRIETTPAWVLRDDYIPRFDSYSRTRTYNTRYDDSSYYRSRPRYDQRTMLLLIEMPLAVATVSDLDGIRGDDLGRYCGALNRGYLPPEEFIDTVRYAPAVFVERPDFVAYLDAQIGNGVVGIRLYDTIYPQLPSYSRPSSIAFSPDYVLNDQYYIPQPVRTRFQQAVINGGYQQQTYTQQAYAQPAYIPQPAVAQPVYTQQPAFTQQPVAQPAFAQQRERGAHGRPARVTATAQPSFTQQPIAQPAFAQQHERGAHRRPARVTAVAQPAFVPQPAIAQNPNFAPQAAHVPPGQAKKAEHDAERVARQENHGEAHAHGHGQAVQQQPTIVAPPPMASASPAPPPPAPAVAPPPAQDNGKGHGRGPGGEGPPGQQKDKGGKGHGKD